MKKSAEFIITLIAVLIIPVSCVPPQTVPGDDFRVETEFIYGDLMEEYGRYNPADPQMSEWRYSYHPMVHAAWIYRSKLLADSGFSNSMRSAGDTFWQLDANITAQIREGKQELDRDRFLGVIDDVELRARTTELMDDGIGSLNAYARAVMESIALRYENTPEMILNLLGKLYADNPEIAEMPVGTPEENDLSRSRDWLQIALAATGSDGVNALLDWDAKMESLQNLVPEENFWNGRLTHAYVLRTIQLAKAQALGPIMRELAGYRSGGTVSDFHRWMHWDIGRTIDGGGDMYPYTDEDRVNIDDFFTGALLEGPYGEGEEARVVAETLGRSPSMAIVDQFVTLARSTDLECGRRQLGYIGLTESFNVPFYEWLETIDAREQLRETAVQLLEDGGLECGNVPVLGLYSGVLFAASDRLQSVKPAWLTDNHMRRIHEAFIALLPDLVTADERAVALDLLIHDLLQPQFMMAHPELTRYREIFLGIYEDWSETTTFEDSVITEPQFAMMLGMFRTSLGYESQWADE